MVACAACGLDFGELEELYLEHMLEHGDQDEGAATSSASSHDPVSTGRCEASEAGRGRDVMGLVRRVAEGSGARGGRAGPLEGVYASLPVEFHGGTGGFACGYRNAQMLVSALLGWPEVREALGLAAVPTIGQIQDGVERAWDMGLDSLGASQLGGRISGTRKWVGTTEMAAYLASRNLSVEVVDVEGSPGPVADRLLRWVREFFQSQRPAPPLYFQHQGHSRTVVGWERWAEGPSLLVLDPSTRPDVWERALSGQGRVPPSLRLPPARLTHSQYQLLAVRGVLSFHESATIHQGGQQHFRHTSIRDLR